MGFLGCDFLRRIQVPEESAYGLLVVFAHRYDDVIICHSRFSLFFVNDVYIVYVAYIVYIVYIVYILYITYIVYFVNIAYIVYFVNIVNIFFFGKDTIYLSI